ncbi:chorismate mutase [Pseudodesulfovibrio indicus]|uniref:chorismate mutase n=1 Tax=Pseudodesulfovibrio indicus TaxID=1716143 RepID=A0A126QK57_9BACT|nr:chorismate mutase [Pseudodesulfovibrio indicus]AMK10364.1 chorismate mutase [Pseudodesulfovibrio indicus]TDT89248.1 3-phosphoshikimate 1-carboxyvinyltransferase [Pseudodesulfovibrio indicus]
MIKIRKDDNGGPYPDQRREDGRPAARTTSPDNNAPARPVRDDRRGPRKFDKRGPKRGGRDFFGRRPEPTQVDFDAPDKSEKVAGHRFDDISDIDNQILGLLEKRAYLIRKEGAWRKSRQKSLVDPKLEKLLRGSFDQAAGRMGLDAKLSKQLFTLLNQFSLADIRKKFEGEGYKLAPRVEPVSAGITGPRSFRHTRMMLAMAASAGTPITLAPVTMNAPNKDLAKALKQVDAPINWDDDFIRNEGGKTLEFEGKMVFVGEDPFNFYMLLCLALGHAGRCKFTGKPGLQLLDASALNKVLPSLGARVVPMNPNNPGLPVRLECGGVMEESVTLPGGLDPDFAAALTLAAWSFPGGLTIGGLTRESRSRVAEAVAVLSECGIEAKLGKDSVTVPDGIPAIDPQPLLPLSVRLGSMLLALPVLSGGRINVDGAWPKSEQADAVLEQLRALGLRVDVATENLIATMEGELPESADITIGAYPDLMPLALALALKVGKARITGADNEVALELLDRLGASYEVDGDVVELKPGSRQWDGTWFSPDPVWSMGCALAAYAVPGIVLENHGEVTATWPEFWNFYNSLPTGKMKPKPEREKKDDTRRRIKIR